jgi:LysR family hydrogen peroxide-inducible transcriptional activator
MTTHHLVDALAEDLTDAGLVATAESHRGLVSQTLFEEPFIAYVGRDHPLAGEASLDPEDLSAEDLWLLDEGHCLRDQVLQLCSHDERHGQVPRMRFQSGNLETLRHLVDRVGGMTLLPYLAIRFLDASKRVQLRPFRAPKPSRTVHIIHRRATLKHALVQALVRVLVDEVTPLLPETPLATATAP